VLAYAAVADLLGNVDPALFAELPDVQQVAVDRVLLRSGSEGPQTDHRVVAAVLASSIERLAVRTPVLIAIDDVQWLDPSSQAVISFAGRRFDRRVGILVTERCDADSGTSALWLHLGRPDGLDRLTVSALSLGGLHALISARLGRTFARPTMVRIAEISGGNPFYALELARAIDMGSANAHSRLPGTLAELMRMRIGRLDPGVKDLLLVAASVATPTMELLAQVAGTTSERAAELLSEAQAKGILAIDGNTVRFPHPLLARSVYTDASPAERRATHRLLAESVILPELKARHMALAASSADPETLKALTPPPTSRALAAPPRPRPTWSSWPSGSAGTSRRAESARPSTISRPATPPAPAHCSSRPSINCSPGCCAVSPST
jgi:hypothetical protein